MLFGSFKFLCDDFEKAKGMFNFKGRISHEIGSSLSSAGETAKCLVAGSIYTRIVALN